MEVTPKAKQCSSCGKLFYIGDQFASDIVCGCCAKKYPPSLLKACCDPFDYALGLRDGKVLFFNKASINGEWVFIHLNWDGDNHQEHFNPEIFGYPMCRGIDIRLDQIIWCADAPTGS